MKKLEPICDICLSTNIDMTKHKQIIRPPKKIKHPNRRTTYGYLFKRYICECGNMWEVKYKMGSE